MCSSDSACCIFCTASGTSTPSCNDGSDVAKPSLHTIAKPYKCGIELRWIRCSRCLVHIASEEEACLGKLAAAGVPERGRLLCRLGRLTQMVAQDPQINQRSIQPNPVA